MGGYRAHGGRKTGPVDLTVVPTTEKAPRRRQRAGLELALALYARGVRTNEIARRLDREDHTIRAWIREHPEIVAAEVEKVAGGAAELFRAHVPRAVETTVEIMERAKRGDATRLAAAQQVLDEAFGKPIVRTEAKVASVITVIFEDEPDAGPQVPGGPQVIDGSSRPIG
jgi:transposase